jgi:hypothetical protein
MRADGPGKFMDSLASITYKARPFDPHGEFQTNAQVAQLVEQRTENPRVGGSIPPLGTSYFNDLGRLPQY